MVDLSGYAILIVQDDAGQVKLYGSPAEEAELEIGDEIVAVNGRCLAGYTHGQIINYIHQCIQSKTIQLTVRRTRQQLRDLGAVYVVAVEDEARNRLETLAASHKLLPVDMTKLGSVDPPTAQVLAVLEGSVNSLEADSSEGSPYKLVSTEVHVEGTPRNCLCNSSQKTASLQQPHVKVPVTTFAADHRLVYNQANSQDLGLAQRVSSYRTVLGEITNNPATANGPCSSLSKNLSKSLNMETKVINGYMHNPGSNSHRTNLGYGSDPRIYNGQHDYGDHDPRNFSSLDHVYSGEHDDVVLNDDRPHREMAIDCPADFAPVKKEPPRYPPRQNMGSTSRSTPTTPARQLNGTRGSVPTVSVVQPPRQSKEEEMEQMERIRKYQEDLRKRKEDEERLNREEEFLRTSLRGSKKLQMLEEMRAKEAQRGPPQSFVNPSYVVEEEEGVANQSQTPQRAARTRGNTEALLGKKPLGTDEITTLLHHIQSKLKSVEDQKELAVLSQLIRSQPFQRAITTHNQVITQVTKTPIPQPVGTNAQELSGEIVSSLATRMNTTMYMEELRRLLASPVIQYVLMTHDKVATQKSEAPPALLSNDDERQFLIQRASQYNEDSIKIVRLQKTADPLGATVRNEGESVIIGRIVKGGAAEKSGLLHEGDEILEINNTDVRGKNVNDVCDLMASMTGTLTFLIVPREDYPRPPPSPQESKALVHVKALFNYDPDDDLYIPCRELGIPFQKGDILHVINQDDPNWWQAYREGEDNQTLAGLIPSSSFQEQRVRHTIYSEGKEDGKKKSRCVCGRNHGKKKKKDLYNPYQNEDDEILTYEEVGQYYPQPNRKRPIVLIGPPDIGRQELRKRLVQTHPDRFDAPIAHTSRPKDPSEKDGTDFHFVPRQIIESEINANKFVEFGEYEKHLYATSMVAIHQVVSSGKICVLTFEPQSLRVLKSEEARDIKPYIVFIAPPKLERLRQIKLHQGQRVTDEKLQEIIDKARQIEDNFGHFFDYIIVHMDPERTYQEIMERVNALDMEPQWVPLIWLT